MPATGGNRPLLLEIQALVSPTDLPCQAAAPRRPKRLAMIVAVLTRHAGLSLGQADVFVTLPGGLRIDEPEPTRPALAIASAARGGRPCRARLR